MRELEWNDGEGQTTEISWSASECVRNVDV